MQFEIALFTIRKKAFYFRSFIKKKIIYSETIAQRLLFSIYPAAAASFFTFYAIFFLKN